MTEQTNQEGQKTVVSFIAGLLVGGVLVWIFSDTPAQAPVPSTDTTNTEEVAEPETETNTDADASDETEPETNVDNSAAVSEAMDTPTLETGEADVSLDTVSAGSVLTLDGATFPTDEGWIAVRSYTGGQLGNILGASRYSKAQGLVPEAVQLLVPMQAGREYAVVFFSENGDREFNLATDTQLDTDITTFTAQ